MDPHRIKSTPDHPFEYPKLEYSRDIRLLRVLAAEQDPSRLLIEFRTVSLDNLPVEYYAVSYCWGDHAPTDKVWCTNHHYLYITSSASYILRKIIQRKSEPSAYVWLDALCINQKENQEKSKQILLMREIPSSAYRVIACLGDPGNDDPDVLKFLESLRDAMKQLNDQRSEVTMGSLC